MAELDQPTRINVLSQVASPAVGLWLLAAAALSIPLILLTMALDSDSFPSQDQTVLDWVTTHGFLGLGGISDVI